MSMIFVFSVLMILSVFTTKISSRFGIPLLLVFMLIGIIFGSDVLNLFYFDDALLTKRLADILIIFILFDGGYSTTRAAFRRVAGPGAVDQGAAGPGGPAARGAARSESGPALKLVFE